MSKRRVMSDKPARRVIRISPPSQTAQQFVPRHQGGARLAGDCTRTWSSVALRDHHEAAVPQAGDGRQRRAAPAATSCCGRTRAFSPRSLAQRRISDAPIVSVPSRCLICSRSAATPWKCSSVTRASSPGSIDLGLSIVSAHVHVLRAGAFTRAAWASSGGWLCGISAIGVAPWPSPVSTKLDAMNWPSRAMPAACVGNATRRRGWQRWTGSRRCRRFRRRGCPGRGHRSARRRRHSAVQDVVAGTADQDVVAVAAIGGELDAVQVRTPR